MSALTLTETTDSLHSALRDYIEATYHISDEGLVRLRRHLLDEYGVVRQRAYIESTPRYVTGRSFENLGLPDPALDILLTAASVEVDGSRLVHNPPFQHQAQSLRGVLADSQSLMVTTGTGSGKTECFLLPILGRLAIEAAQAPGSFSVPAVRAILLYPMNALVNDQLGRLRLLFGDSTVAGKFASLAGRPARFARYTSRTLYPGVRTSARDQRRLAPIGKYYVKTAREAAGEGSPKQVKAAQELIAELRGRGKWPAKPDIVRWFGSPGARWQDREGSFLRCVTLPDDPELLTRHEVLATPPDVLVTNYSMLEYMLMRPLERPLFDATRRWLGSFPSERLLLVVDEAHLYRGAAGTEVALLLRRLRDRLGLSEDRLQVICTSASFADGQRAVGFGAKLTGKKQDDFLAVRGELDLRPGAAPGTVQEAELLSSLDLERFYAAEDLAEKLEMIKPLLTYRGIEGIDPRTALYEALGDYPPMSLLVNETMKAACRVDELGPQLFPEAPVESSQKAAAALVAMGSYAREAGSLDGPGLLPSRVHAFFRGLPGLWICVDPDCDELPQEDRGGPGGALYDQPRGVCACGGRVFEFLTCRQCGTAYCRGYADSVDDPHFLWPDPGERIETPAAQLAELEPIDILLSEPAADASARPADLDITTGRIDPPRLGKRVRQVFLPGNRQEQGNGERRDGAFRPCAVCGKQASFGRSYVQDHQTKGDEPFQALVTRQVEVQQPTAPPTPFAPLGGRKVLVFSDSRQTAARLAPNLQKYTTRDAIRPLLVSGFTMLSVRPSLRRRLSLEDSYLAILLASSEMKVRLRPPTKTGENFESDLGAASEFLASGGWDDPERQLDLVVDFRSRNAPEYLVHAITDVINHPYYGLASLALASLVEAENKNGVVDGLSDLPGFETIEDKRILLRLWLDAWPSQWLSAMPSSWANMQVHPESGKFPTRLKRVLGSTSLQKEFANSWVPELLAAFARPATSKYFLKGNTVSLSLGGDWAYCQSCRSTQRPFSVETRCTNCGRDSARRIDPDSDPVFVARKGYYRRDTIEAVENQRPPLALIAAEHTAQLNDAQADEVFSDAEEHELLFQDVDLGTEAPAIDVLSCTTTMEVGIDIGALSGVALRNMPPGRANYQQRAGRAGRRSRAVATVTAFASADSHDEHSFSDPDGVIRGDVSDPELGLDNWIIARRHLTAFLLQHYLQEKLPSEHLSFEGADQTATYGAQLFEVLGTVEEFKDPSSVLNRTDFATWLESNEDHLAERARSWLPSELSDRIEKGDLVLAIRGTALEIDSAIDVETGSDEDTSTTSDDEADESEGDQLEIPTEEGEEQPTSDPLGEKLLDRLLYRNVLPRYAFPTDVAAFYVFDPDSTPFRPVFQYSPSQSLSVALSQYAPGKTVWIGNKEWRSGAIYSPLRSERFNAWQSRRWYMECRVCGYAKTEDLTNAVRGETRDCPACGSTSELGPAQTWFRPPGFAHPHYWDERTSPDDAPPPSYATRAKLTAPTPADPQRWRSVNNRISSYFDQMRLLVTNAGPRAEGYNYCATCGLVEPSTVRTPTLVPGHQKPFPDNRDPICGGSATARNLVLGTDFISDVLLVSLKVDDPLTLRPEFTSSRISLRTLSEALTKTACEMLGIDAKELLAEYRPALTPSGRAGTEAEIYMYDTLPGGAGFAHRAGELGVKLLEETLSRLEACPAQCESSCYRCLRSYKNKLDHSQLDRHIGASLLHYLLTDEIPSLDPERSAASLDLLLDDLQRLDLGGVVFQRSQHIEVPGFNELTAPILATLEDGRRVVLTLRVPFTTNVLVTPEWMDPAEFSLDPQVVPVDELAVRTSLPRASHEVINSLGLE